MGHPWKFQRVWRLGSVTARHSSSGRQPNFAALNRGHHLCLAGRPSRWALAHILVLSFFFLSFFPRLISAAADWMSAILPHMMCGLSANLRCRSETCCTRLAGNAGRKNDAKNRHLGTIAQICPSGYIFATKARIDNREKHLLNSITSSTCPHNMVNVGPLAAEIVPLVWGTPGNFNGFRVLAALLHGI